MHMDMHSTMVVALTFFTSRVVLLRLNVPYVVCKQYTMHIGGLCTCVCVCVCV